jgi:hypothetical protein
MLQNKQNKNFDEKKEKVSTEIKTFLNIKWGQAFGPYVHSYLLEDQLM